MINVLKVPNNQLTLEQTQQLADKYSFKFFVFEDAYYATKTGKRIVPVEYLTKLADHIFAPGYFGGSLQPTCEEAIQLGFKLIVWNGNVIDAEHYLTNGIIARAEICSYQDILDLLANPFLTNPS